MRVFAYAPLFFWLAAATAAFKFLDHHDHRAKRPGSDRLPEAISSPSKLKSYFAKKGLISEIVNDTVSAACSIYPSVYEVRYSLPYQQIVKSIVASATLGTFKGQTYNDLATFVDTYDRRASGSQLLEDAIDYVKDYMVKIGATNVVTENVSVPAWVRGYESAELMTPRGNRKLGFLGLGQSVPTPPGGITSDTVVFNSFAELTANLIRVKGKIVVLNFAGTPGGTLVTTNNGYPQLAAAGALAALYRSAATFSLNSPHTRRSNLYYDGVAPEIPIGYLSFEAADLLTRLSARGQNITIQLTMENTNTHGYSISRNVFGDLTGSTLPDQYVILAAHVDSWDVSQAAQDDGVGVMLALKALELLKSLQLTPRRTLRLAFFAAEEWNFLGSKQYVSTRGNLANLSVALEADFACLASTGLAWNGHPELGCLVNEIIRLVGSASAGLVAFGTKMNTDLDFLAAKGVPVITLVGDNGQYFWYHHSEADTMTAVNSTEVDRCLALWTSTAYILSDLLNPVTRLF